jgi:hypothetical protein
MTEITNKDKDQDKGVNAGKKALEEITNSIPFRTSFNAKSINKIYHRSSITIFPMPKYHSKLLSSGSINICQA